MDSETVFSYVFRALITGLIGATFLTIRAFRSELKGLTKELSDVMYGLKDVLKDLKQTEQRLDKLEKRDVELDLALDMVKDRILVLEVAKRGG